MKLAVFDIDGTLLDTNRVDADCYVRALEIELGIVGVGQDWDRFTHVTASGILAEIFQKNFNRPPDIEIFQKVEDSFVGLLKQAHQSDPRQFTEIKGARDMLRHLSRTDDWATAIATGDWRASAAFKMECAGLSLDDYPSSTSDDSPAREELVRLSIARAKALYGAEKFSRIVCIGDGRWDIRAAARLELPFIGVGDEDFLQGLGANDVVNNYNDIEGFVRLLDSAQRPGQVSSR